jgi:hypothetical protein
MGNKFITVRLNEQEMFLKSKAVAPNYKYPFKSQFNFALQVC